MPGMKAWNAGFITRVVLSHYSMQVAKRIFPLPRVFQQFQASRLDYAVACAARRAVKPQHPDSRTAHLQLLLPLKPKPQVSVDNFPQLASDMSRLALSKQSPLFWTSCLCKHMYENGNDSRPARVVKPTAQPFTKGCERDSAGR